jgi:putative ABC transport system permease protein
MEGLLQDLRFAIRFLLRNKRSTAIAILCLGTGIGMTTTTFSAVNPWVFRPLPWYEPEQLVGVSEARRDQADALAGVSGPTYLDWARETRSFSTIGAFERANFNLAGDDDPLRVPGARVSSSLFPLFGEEPVLGRAFSPDEDTRGRDAVVVLSHQLWEQSFGSDPDIIGKQVRIDARPHEVIGVMREGFSFPEWGEAWTPLGLSPHDTERAARRYSVVGRLAPGTTLAQAQAELDGLSLELDRRYPLTNGGWMARVRPYREVLIPAGVRIGLTMQLFASIFVLLIACANAANILLAQAASREREIALRTALGASRSRIVRQMLTESMFIAFIAACIGVMISPPLTRLLLQAAPQEPPYWVFMGLDYQVLTFTVSVAALTGVAFGLVPALRASTVDLQGALKEGGRSATRGVRGNRLARMLVAGELALSIVLLVAATLMIRSYLAMSDLDLGYDRDGVLTWRVALPASRYATPEARGDFVIEAVRRVKSIPGVEFAGAVNHLPAVSGFSLRGVEVEGQALEEANWPHVGHHPVTADYLDTLRIRVLEGRSFEAVEVEQARDVVIVSRSLAERFWPGESALGMRLRFGGDAPWLRVVAVTEDVTPPLDVTGTGGVPKWQAYVPLTHAAPETVSFALRTWGEPEALAPAVRSEFRAIDSALSLYEIFSMDEVLFRSIWVTRIFGLMFGMFAIFAVLLSAVGLYGVISYGVAQRTHEVGVRLALGAQPRDVLQLVMMQGLVTTLVGALLGLGLAVLVGWVLSSLLFGVESRDPFTFAGTTLLLTGVALLATFLPALRATRVDPVVALRSG